MAANSEAAALEPWSGRTLLGHRDLQMTEGVLRIERLWERMASLPPYEAAGVLDNELLSVTSRMQTFLADEQRALKLLHKELKRLAKADKLAAKEGGARETLKQKVEYAQRKYESAAAKDVQAGGMALFDPPRRFGAAAPAQNPFTGRAFIDDMAGRGENKEEEPGARGVDFGSDGSDSD